MERIYDLFTVDNMQEILKHSLCELDRFLNRAGKPAGKFERLKENLIAICLCQGAAQHLVESLNIDKFDKTVIVSQEEIQEKGYKIEKNNKVLSGIKDIDIWFFFEENNSVKIPDIANCRKSINVELNTFGNRRLDFLKKSIKDQIIEKASSREPKNILRSYLCNDKNPTPTNLALKSVVGLYPDTIFNSLIWKVQRLQSNKN